MLIKPFLSQHTSLFTFALLILLPILLVGRGSEQLGGCLFAHQGQPPTPSLHTQKYTERGKKSNNENRLIP